MTNDQDCHSTLSPIQESLDLTVVEGWFYSLSTHAGVLTPGGALIGNRAEKVMGMGWSPRLGPPQEESSSSSPEHRTLKNVLSEVWEQKTTCCLLTLVLQPYLHHGKKAHVAAVLGLEHLAMAVGID